MALTRWIWHRLVLYFVIYVQDCVKWQQAYRSKTSTTEHATCADLQQQCTTVHRQQPTSSHNTAHLKFSIQSIENLLSIRRVLEPFDFILLCEIGKKTV